MGMGTVGKATILGELEDLTEVAGELFGFHIEGTKTLDTRGVYQPSTLPKGDHLREGRSVLTCVVGIRDLSCAEVYPRYQTIDQRRLAHPTVATEESDLPFKHRPQKIHPLTCRSRNSLTGVANGLVKPDHHLLIVLFLGREEVCLVKNQDDWDTIGLSRSEEPVDKGRRGLGVVDCDYEEGLIDIGCNDMTLFGEVDAFADDIVPTVLYVSNEGCSFGIRHDRDPVAHSNRVRAANPLQPEVSLDLTINQLAIVRQDGVPAASILNDESFQS